MLTHSEAGKLGYEKTQDKLQKHREQQRASARAAYEANLPHCAFCAAVLPYENYEKRGGKFCNHSCAASFTNVGVTRNPKRRDRRTHCLKCGERIQGSGLIYCSRLCSHAHKADKFARKFLSNSSEVGANNSRTIRKFLIQTLGECCQECGWAKTHPVTGRVPLEIHHLDGNFENNRTENVRLLCPNCHSLTPTFRNLNKGKGRAYRRSVPE